MPAAAVATATRGYARRLPLEPYEHAAQRRASSKYVPHEGGYGPAPGRTYDAYGRSSEGHATPHGPWRYDDDASFPGTARRFPASSPAYDSWHDAYAPDANASSVCMRVSVHVCLFCVSVFMCACDAWDDAYTQNANAA